MLQTTQRKKYLLTFLSLSLHLEIKRVIKNIIQFGSKRILKCNLVLLMLSLIEINVICCADVRLFCYKMSTRPVVVAAAAVSESFLQQLRFIQCNHCRNVREMCVFLCYYYYF